MSHRLEPLLNEIRDLEKLVSDKIHDATDAWPLEFKHGKPVFDPGTRQRHKLAVKRLWRFFRDSPLLTTLTTPVIYSLLVPVSLLDLLMSIYQRTCFSIYGVPRVRRADYVVLDRHRLAYLNVIERAYCSYCDYANGVLAYAREVASRTEQYWCPIKHARRVKDCHARHCLFCEYGDAEGFRKEYETLRRQFSDIERYQERVADVPDR